MNTMYSNGAPGWRGFNNLGASYVLYAVELLFSILIIVLAGLKVSNKCGVNCVAHPVPALLAVLVATRLLRSTRQHFSQTVLPVPEVALTSSVVAAFAPCQLCLYQSWHVLL
jgi:hypothetical protein